MANIKSAKKDIRKTERRTAQNRVFLVELDKAVKQLRKNTEGSLNRVYALLDKMSSKGIIKKNTAARKKSSFAAKAKHV